MTPAASSWHGLCALGWGHRRQVGLVTAPGHVHLVGRSGHDRAQQVVAGDALRFYPARA